MKTNGQEIECCGCVNPNACDCLRGGINVYVQQGLRELHEQTDTVEADLQIDQPPGVANLSAPSRVKGAYL